VLVLWAYACVTAKEGEDFGTVDAVWNLHLLSATPKINSKRKERERGRGRGTYVLDSNHTPSIRLSITAELSERQDLSIESFAEGRLDGAIFSENCKLLAHSFAANEGASDGTSEAGYAIERVENGGEGIFAFADRFEGVSTCWTKRHHLGRRAMYLLVLHC